MSELIVGGIYKMNHQRKGQAIVRILGVGDPWIDIEIVKGSIKGIGAGSYRGIGDKQRVRDSLAVFEPHSTEGA